MTDRFSPAGKRFKHPMIPNGLSTMITDPAFYLLAIPAIILTGLAKGGFLGALGGLAVPMMSLVISPIQAAGIMLPILNAMDLVGVAAYRRDWDARNLAIILPAGVLGVGLGWATAAYVTEAHIRLMVGLIGLVFAGQYWLSLAPAGSAPGPDRLKGTAWGTISGFTSFVSHSGAPPLQVYLLPQRMANAAYAATSVMFFTTINLVKLIPYAALGQFSTANLATTAVLLPLAPIAMMAGVWLTRRVPQEPFYRIAYGGLLIISVKHIWDAGHALR